MATSKGKTTRPSRKAEKINKTVREMLDSILASDDKNAIIAAEETILALYERVQTEGGAR